MKNGQVLDSLIHHSRYRLASCWQKPIINFVRFVRNQLRKRGLKFDETSEYRSVEIFHQKGFLIVSGEGVGEQLADYGIYEESLTEAAVRLIKPGMTVIDVGCHLGYYTTLFAVLVGENGCVTSFEPTPSTRKLTKLNSDRYHQTNVRPEALWSSEGILTFRDYGLKWFAFNSFTKAKSDLISTEAKEIQVPTITLDRLRKVDGRRIDLIKIDAESAEVEILKGSQDILALDRPVISIEMGDRAENCQSLTIFEIFKKAHYQPWEYGNGKFRLHQPRNWYTYDNLIFAPLEHDLSKR